MIWLALKIALAKPIDEVEAGGRPIGFSPPPAFSGLIPKLGYGLERARGLCRRRRRLR